MECRQTAIHRRGLTSDSRNGAYENAINNVHISDVWPLYLINRADTGRYLPNKFRNIVLTIDRISFVTGDV